MLKTISKSIVLPVFALIALDQIIKWAVVSGGLSFTLNEGLPLFNGVYISSSVYIFLALLLIFLLMVANKYVNKSLVVPVLLVMSGALSNVIDRVVRGGVVDFIDIKIWPVFNLADLLLVAGAVWIVLIISKRGV